MKLNGESSAPEEQLLVNNNYINNNLPLIVEEDLVGANVNLNIWNLVCDGCRYVAESEKDLKLHKIHCEQINRLF